MTHTMLRTIVIAAVCLIWTIGLLWIGTFAGNGDPLSGTGL